MDLNLPLHWAQAFVSASTHPACSPVCHPKEDWLSIGHLLISLGGLCRGAGETAGTLPVCLASSPLPSGLCVEGSCPLSSVWLLICPLMVKAESDFS